MPAPPFLLAPNQSKREELCLCRYRTTQCGPAYNRRGEKHSNVALVRVSVVSRRSYRSTTANKHIVYEHSSHYVSVFGTLFFTAFLSLLSLVVSYLSVFPSITRSGYNRHSRSFTPYPSLVTRGDCGDRLFKFYFAGLIYYYYLALKNSYQIWR